MTLTFNDARKLSLADETDITPANSGGGAAGWTWNDVWPGTGTIRAKTGPQRIRGVGVAGQPCSLRKNDYSAPSFLALDVLFGTPGTPTSDARIIELTSSSHYLRVEVNTAGLLKVYWSGGSLTGGTDLRTLSNGLRVALGFTVGASVSLYVKTYDGLSTTPVDNLSTSTANLGTNPFTALNVIKANTTPGHTLDYHYAQLENASSTELPPRLNPPVVAGTPGDILGADLEGLVSSGSGAPYTIHTVTQTGGTTVTGLDHSDSPLAFWCDRASVVDVCTFDVVVRDSSSTSSDPFEVTVQPAAGGRGFRVWDGAAFQGA